MQPAVSCDLVSWAGYLEGGDRQLGKVALPVTCASWAPGQERPVPGMLAACAPVSFWLSLAQTVCSPGLVPAMEETSLASGQSPNPAFRPSSGAEQTEKADAPREPPPVELKPDPTSSMAAAEAEALSESSEQGAPPPARARLPPHPRGSPLSSVSSLASHSSFTSSACFLHA